MINTIPTFLVKLRRLLDENTSGPVISWDNSGNSFHIYDMNTLSKVYLPNYFKHNNYASFVRQLNMYGFRKINRFESSGINYSFDAKDDIEFQHPFFTRDDLSLMSYIQRRPTISNSSSNYLHSGLISSLNADSHGVSNNSQNVNSISGGNLSLVLLSDKNVLAPVNRSVGSRSRSIYLPGPDNGENDGMVFDKLYNVLHQLCNRHKEMEFRVEQLEREKRENRAQIDRLESNLQQHTNFTKQLVNVLVHTNPELLSICKRRPYAAAFIESLNDLMNSSNSSTAHLNRPSDVVRNQHSSNKVLALTNGRDSESFTPPPSPSFTHQSNSNSASCLKRPFNIINNNDGSISSPPKYPRNLASLHFEAKCGTSNNSSSRTPNQDHSSKPTLSRMSSLAEIDLDEFLNNMPPIEETIQQSNSSPLSEHFLDNVSESTDAANYVNDLDNLSGDQNRDLDLGIDAIDLKQFEQEVGEDLSFLENIFQSPEVKSGKEMEPPDYAEEVVQSDFKKEVLEDWNSNYYNQFADYQDPEGGGNELDCLTNLNLSGLSTPALPYCSSPTVHQSGSPSNQLVASSQPSSSSSSSSASSSSLSSSLPRFSSNGKPLTAGSRVIVLRQAPANHQAPTNQPSSQLQLRPITRPSITRVYPTGGSPRMTTSTTAVPVMSLLQRSGRK